MSEEFLKRQREYARENTRAMFSPASCKFTEYDVGALPGHIAAMGKIAAEAEARKNKIGRYASDEERAARVRDIDQEAYDAIRAHRRAAGELLDALKVKRDEKRRRARNLCEPHTLDDWQKYDMARESIRAKVRRAGPADVLAEYHAAIGDAARYAVLDAARAQIEALAELPELADDATARRQLVGWQAAVDAMQQEHYAKALEVDVENGAAIELFERGLGQQYGATEKLRERERIDRLYGTRVAHLEAEPIERAAVIPFRESSGIQRTPEPEPEAA